MRSVFDVLLSRGKIESQIERNLKGKVDGELLAHQIDFKDFLKLMNQFIKDEIKLIDDMLIEILKKKHDVPTATTHFIHQVSLKMFGSLSPLVLDDYHKFVQGFTAYNQLEANLRAYLIQIIQSECHFDIYSGKNNLEEISDKFIKVLDNWLLYIASKPAYRNSVDEFIRENYEGKEQRFMNVLMYFVSLMVISNLFLEKVKKGVFKTKYNGNIVEIVSKIYHRNSLSIDQYNLLKKYGLEGGIAYRGLSLNLKHAIQMLSKNITRGTSWSSSYPLALHFASQNNVEEIMKKVFSKEEGFKIKSKSDFRRLVVKANSQKLHNKRLYLLLDDPKIALEILMLINNSKKDSLKKSKPYIVEVAPKHDSSVGFTSKGDATIGVILSYDVINDKVLIYLGEGAPKHFVSENWLDQKEIVISIPKKFSINEFAFDMIIPIIIKPLNLKLIGDKEIDVIEKVLSKNGVSEKIIEYIIKKKNKMTIEHLNAYLKSQKVHGKIIGKLNISLRSLN